VIFKATNPITDYDGSKQLQNVEHFNCLGSVITSDPNCTRGIKSRIVLEKQHYHHHHHQQQQQQDFSLPNWT
jgi:hypothetical protein